MWMGDAEYRLAPALATLIRQLEEAYPSPTWQLSPQTGTIGDAAHISEGAASDHNPWLNSTVRAFDCAANIRNGPPAEALFQMVNRMYAARDPRVWPDGYAIFNYRVTDWNNPGGYHAQTGDPHLYHVHISVSQSPAGYNATNPWPLPTSTALPVPTTGGFLMALTDQAQADVAHQVGVTDANVKLMMSWLQSMLLRTAQLQAKTDALQKTVESMGGTVNIDQAAVEAAVHAAVSGLTLTGSLA